MPASMLPANPDALDCRRKSREKFGSRPHCVLALSKIPAIRGFPGNKLLAAELFNWLPIHSLLLFGFEKFVNETLLLRCFASSLSISSHKIGLWCRKITPQVQAANRVQVFFPVQNAKAIRVV